MKYLDIYLVHDISYIYIICAWYYIARISTFRLLCLTFFYLCFALPCRAVLCAVLCALLCALPCCVPPRYAVPSRAVCRVVLYAVLRCCTVLCRAALSCAVLCRVVLCFDARAAALQGCHFSAGLTVFRAHRVLPTNAKGPVEMARGGGAAWGDGDQVRGVARHGVLWWRVVGCGGVRYGAVWHGVVWLDLIRRGLT